MDGTIPQTENASKEKNKSQNKPIHPFTVTQIPENSNTINDNTEKFNCKFCSKIYLSNTALRNHMFNKHSSILDSKTIKRKKAGRPRENKMEHFNLDNNYMRNKYAKFWEMKKRKKNLYSVPINMENILNIVFSNLYINYWSLLNNGNKLNSWKEHPFLKLLINPSNNKNNDNNNKNITCDIALKLYIDSIKDKTNENYLIFIIKFLVLYRECFNFSKNLVINVPLEKNIERSTVISSDQLPKIANEFFTDYLKSKNFFEYSIDLDALIEMSEIVQNLCYFLQVKNLTSLRLILINKQLEKNNDK